LNPFALLIARVEIVSVDENELDKAMKFILMIVTIVFWYFRIRVRRRF